MNPTLGVHIVYAGHNSTAGHMFIALTAANGNTSSYGFYPSPTGFYGPGEVRRTDFAEHNPANPP
jgi:hypothetical protein